MIKTLQIYEKKQQKLLPWLAMAKNFINDEVRMDTYFYRAYVCKCDEFLLSEHPVKLKNGEYLPQIYFK